MRSLPIRLTFAAALGGLALSSPLPANAQADPTPDATACQNAVRQALAAKAAPAAEVSFDAAPILQADLSNDSQRVLRGAGRSRGSGAARAFTYSCSVDAHSSATVGLVLRDVAPVAAAAASATPPRPRADPDLSHVSPADCESSAAEALKQRWPRVAQISFDGDTRKYLQESATKAELQGQGRALPTPDSPHTHFGFDCQIDPRDGRVLGLHLSG
jgi:hypothetical protein